MMFYYHFPYFKWSNIIFLIPDVRLRRVRAHHVGARGTLHAPQEATPLLPCAAEVLRQTTLQIYERILRKPTLGTAPYACPQLKVPK